MESDFLLPATKTDYPPPLSTTRQCSVIAALLPSPELGFPYLSGLSDRSNARPPWLPCLNLFCLLYFPRFSFLRSFSFRWERSRAAWSVAGGGFWGLRYFFFFLFILGDRLALPPDAFFSLDCGKAFLPQRRRMKWREFPEPCTGWVNFF